jgi:hypothetical protein
MTQVAEARIAETADLSTAMTLSLLLPAPVLLVGDVAAAFLRPGLPPPFPYDA